MELAESVEGQRSESFARSSFDGAVGNHLRVVPRRIRPIPSERSDPRQRASLLDGAGREFRRWLVRGRNGTDGWNILLKHGASKPFPNEDEKYM